MQTSRDPWLTSLARVLRLAGALSATTASCVSSSPSAPPSSQDLSAVGIMSASMAAPRALSRARLIRSRPGFVPSVSASTCGCAGRRGAGSNTVAAQALNGLGRPTLPPHHQAYPSSPTKEATAVLERWFMPRSGATAAGRARRLFSSGSASISPSPAAINSVANDDQSVAETYGGSKGEAEMAVLSSRHDETEEEDGPAPFKVSYDPVQTARDIV